MKLSNVSEFSRSFDKPFFYNSRWKLISSSLLHLSFQFAPYDFTMRVKKNPLLVVAKLLYLNFIRCVVSTNAHNSVYLRI
jgi:hypothetical protein